MKRFAKKIARAVLPRSTVRSLRRHNLAPDMDREFAPMYSVCADYSMTTIERMYALYEATTYLVENGIEGDFVECGVWRGGSSMVAAYNFVRLGDTSRRFYLYDTYEGMSQPTEKDVTFDDRPAAEKWQASQSGSHNRWNYSPVEDVRENLAMTGYPSERVTLIKGKVEDTIPGTIPERIALLRLDTDFFESTYHELEHLFPRLVQGGVLIIDDYGHWKGAREATDQYFREHPARLLLNRVDYSGRIAVRVDV